MSVFICLSHLVKSYGQNKKKITVESNVKEKKKTHNFFKVQLTLKQFYSEFYKI
jgi:hypothetical protein